MSESKNYILGVFDDEDVLMNAVHEVRNAGIKIHEVYSPFAIHGLDESLGYKRSRLDIAAFLFGFLGMTLGLTMMISMNGYDWPMNVGGKSNAPIPDFIPITFECTVLFAAFGMVGTFFTASNLFPWSKNTIFDNRITDDKFIIAIEILRNKMGKDDITKVLSQFGATEINEKNI